jgi:hypothetical protein
MPTAGQIGKIICHAPRQTVAQAIERVRHWTKSGLLITAGAAHPGSGKRRTYAETAVGEALLLNAMAELGIPTDRARPVLDRARAVIPDIFRKVRAGADRILLICPMPDGDPYITVLQPGVLAALPKQPAALMVSMGAAVRQAIELENS